MYVKKGEAAFAPPFSCPFLIISQPISLSQEILQPGIQ